MITLYYLVAALVVLYLVLQLAFDVWIYITTKNFDFVLDAWLNRRNNSFRLSPAQMTFRKSIRVMGQVIFCIGVILLLIEIVRMEVSHE